MIVRVCGDGGGSWPPVSGHKKWTSELANGCGGRSWSTEGMIIGSHDNIVEVRHMTFEAF